MPTIMIWGHYHGGNLGDECIVIALMANLRARLRQVELIGVCENPPSVQARYGIRAVPIRQMVGTAAPVGPGLRSRIAQRLPLARLVARRLRAVGRCALEIAREPLFLWRCWRALRGVEALVVAGSGPLTDEWGKWRHPYAVFKWAMLARASGTSYIPLSVGAGPLDSKLARWFVRKAMQSSSYRSYRDPSSARLVAEQGVEGENAVVPDLAFSLNVADFRGAPRTEGEKLVVGLNVMAHSDPRYDPRGRAERFRTYLEKMADFAERLVRQGHHVRLLPSQIRFDLLAAQDMLEVLARRPGLNVDGQIVLPSIVTVPDLLREIAGCHYIVAARYHCILLPQMLATPVVALAYHPKTSDLMNAMGMSSYCLDIDRFVVEDLVRCLERLMENADAIRYELGVRTADARRAVCAQYDRLFGAPC